MDKKVIFILVSLMVATITFAQSTGGEIKRTTTHPRNRANYGTGKKTNSTPKATTQKKSASSHTVRKSSASSANSNVTFSDAPKKQIIENLVANMVYVEGGTFMMGETTEQDFNPLGHERPVHQVSLTDFYIGRYEVTELEWMAIMEKEPIGGKGEIYPIKNVSWEDCQSFIRRWNNITGLTFRLPTEAEWEYAARGGEKSHGFKYAGGNNLEGVAWFSENSADKGQNSPDYGPQPVSRKFSNELGLYDMSGNVSEWCNDWYGDYISEKQNNPSGPYSGTKRVFRGGSWFMGEKECRVSYRESWKPNDLCFNLGFRLAL